MVLITGGATTTFGTGIYEFGLPVNRTASTPANNIMFGTARVVDGGSVGYWGAVGAGASAGKCRIQMSSAAATGLEVSVSQTAPMTAANGDTWGGNFAYIAA